jgi:hypothetical protein
MPTTRFVNPSPPPAKEKQMNKYVIVAEVIVDPQDDIDSICDTIAEAIPWMTTEVVSIDHRRVVEEFTTNGNLS